MAGRTELYIIINLSFYVIFERYVIRLLRIWNNLMAHRKMVQVNYTFREIICSKIFNVAKTQSLISELELKKIRDFNILTDRHFGAVHI